MYIAINQCWIFELAELDHMTSKNDQSALKALFSSATDSYPPPYARGIGKFPRPSAFAATWSRFDFLIDPSAGHRMFLVIPLKQDPAKEE